MQEEWRWEIHPDENRRDGIRKLEFEAEGQRKRKRDWKASPREPREQKKRNGTLVYILMRSDSTDTTPLCSLS